MDAISDSDVDEVVVMASAQVGKTEIINNIVGFHIAQDPAPLLLVQPTVEIGEAWSTDRLAPMLRDTPALRDKVKDPRTRDSGNKILQKRFPGGHITIAGANAPAGLAGRPIRVVLLDEVDRYPPSAGTEGDPVTLAKKRTRTFWNRKHILCSTPTVKGFSRIEMAYEQSDKRRFYVPCPHCDEPQVLKWENVKWPANEPEKASYHCVACGAAWSNVERLSAIRLGQWRAEAPFKGRAGFHLNELYSPWSTIPDIATAFINAKDSPETLRAWINTTLGETWEEEGERVDQTGLMERAEEWSEDAIPNGVLVIVIGVDTQDDRLELEIVGWGRDEESWSLRYQVLDGDPSGNAVWAQLDEIRKQEFTRADGARIKVSAVCIDSRGHQTQAVYKYCRPRFGQKVYAIAGMGGPGRLVWPQRASKNNSGKVNLFLIGVDAAKDAIYARLRIQTAGAGFCHFPKGRDPDWFAQLTAESVQTVFKKGFPTRVWQKKPGVRNEALDCRVYAYAALQSLNVAWSRFRDLRPPVVPPPADAPPMLPPPPPQVALQSPVHRGRRVYSRGI